MKDLKQTTQEWIGCGECDDIFKCHAGKAKCIRLQAEPLSAAVIGNMMPSTIPMEYDGALMEFARAIEQAHNIKEET
jgi:hypothetical protein